MGHTHALIGSCLALGVAIETHADPKTTLLLLAVGGFAAILPDIDHPRAPLRRKLGLLGNLLFGRLKHRGLTHTLIAIVAIASGSLFALPHPLGAVVVLGYVSHILSDMITVSGLPVFWPYSDQDYHLIPKRFCMTTNTWPEHLISLGLVVAIGSQIPHFLGPIMRLK
jgi:inner membrane protein